MAAAPTSPGRTQPVLSPALPSTALLPPARHFCGPLLSSQARLGPLYVGACWPLRDGHMPPAYLCPAVPHGPSVCLSLCSALLARATHPPTGSPLLPAARGPSSRASLHHLSFYSLPQHPPCRRPSPHGQQGPRGARAAHPPPSAGCLLGAKPLPPPRDWAAVSGSFFALTTFVISRAGRGCGLRGTTGTPFPPFLVPFPSVTGTASQEPGLRGWTRAVCERPSAPAVPSWD